VTTTIDILLVDDEPRNLDALDAILADPGYRLLRAQDADQALRLLLENEVAAIVLDIKMPGVSGFELAQMIKGTRRFRETPIVFLTAYMVDDQHVITGYGAGAVDYLTKPVNPQVLRHKIAVFAELFRKTRLLAELNETLEQRVKDRTAELERSEAALRAAGDQKDQFLAVLAHELRNPLAPLRTGLDLLIHRQQAKSPRIDRVLGAMDRQLDHMVRLIDDLLDVSRISRGYLDLKKERTAVEEIVEAAIDGVRPFFERRHQVLSVSLAPGIVADADPTRLAQIVGNVLHNAAKFTPDGGRVDVTLAYQDGRAVVRVADSGVGLTADQLGRVFEMFARIERPGDVGSGLGIGLALARRLAEMHGATLTAASEGEGRGATFTLSLPATETAPRAAQTAAESSRVMAPLKVVIIEDNEDVAETLAEYLQEIGHEVLVAHNGQRGVALVEEARPTVVLCDLGLPEMDGFEVCRRVRALAVSSQPCMIALTGWGRDADLRKTNAAGFDHHLVKPVEAAKLRNLLRTVGEAAARA
jgi:signal transduction histidine kinase